MNCPVCKTALKRWFYHNIEVDLCHSCRGIWFEEGELKPAIDQLIADDDTVPNAEAELHREIVAPHALNEAERKCPRCAVVMEKLNYGADSNIFLDRCPECSGLWADAGEIRELAVFTKGHPRVDRIADGLAEVAKGQDRMRALADFARLLKVRIRRWF